ncbi:MAG TPA: MCE family protein [Gordonia sp. (in: high G+C Gram-positive bacteria)]|uniref:MlaD family protein n=1 Tax=unclassified Gordonia (in: high G+C Gram-positive bacteria) TaxID=2657482 RepID=UPI000FADF38C|nr:MULTISPECIES: MCE family protein [unclassified Gordonia (in: high G+C Gram-positive bacteria)]RUP37483.1 MAG: MCE family protein [Gordonia sp. (in: high G+C Gram-positive bacteria)]HNP58174.1 MCE family protein [Gordonia sp. (in: high G+C Gram-positive bacteria)]HRC51761.1 MCE family protein [Gordonia sp. (in: high G+C Gram-positive bacteria)]
MPFIDTTGRNPSLTSYTFRGLAFLVGIIVLLTLLALRYTGTFDKTVPVTATLKDVGDGLVSAADVRYNGYIVGEVSGVTSTDDGQMRLVHIDLDPKQATGIPGNVTARTVPSNLFGVNSVELIPPVEGATPTKMVSGTNISADTTQQTLALQDAQNQLRDILRAVPPEQLSAVLATIADAMRGGGTTFAMFSESLREYFEQLNALFPAGAPPGFDNFNATVVGLSRSAPQLLDALGKSVVPAATIAENQRNLTALLSAAQGVTDEAQALFAANGDTAKPLVTDLSRTVGAAVLEPRSLPDAIVALNRLAARAQTVFTGINGHAQLNLGVSFSAFMRYTRQNCPVYNGGKYGQLRGPGCVGPGTGTGPTSSGPLMIYPPSMRRMAAGSVTTGTDVGTLRKMLGRDPSPAEILMLGPLVDSTRVQPTRKPGSAPAGPRKPSAQQPSGARNRSEGGR